MARRSRRQGYFISLEGPECAGKSTQAGLLAAALRRRGHAVLETREPGGTPLGEALRRVLKETAGAAALCAAAELLLFGASRAQLLAQAILPHLAAGGVVVCDRFADSTTAYQGYGRGLDLATIARVHAVAVGRHWPDMTLLLDVGPTAARRRGRTRAPETPGRADRFESEAAAFHRRVRAGYLALARRQPKRFAVIRATGDRDAVHRRIWEVVSHAVG